MPQRNARLALWFAVQADMKFLSHRDTLRLWRHALARAAAPVRYTKGFNPHMRITLPLPRSVGTAATAELLIIHLEQTCDAEQLCAGLQKKMPPHIRIVGAREAPDGATPAPDWAEYRLTLSPQADRRHIRRRIGEFYQSAQWLVERPARTRHPRRTVNLRDTIVKIQQLGDEVRCIIKTRLEGTARLEELLELLQIGSPGKVAEIDRINTAYPAGWKLQNQTPAAPRRQEPT